MPVEELPPVTVEGLSVTLPTVPCVDGGTALMVRSAVMVLAEVAEIVTGVELATAEVVTVKVAVVWPAGIETLAGTVAAGLLDESVTLTPAAAAGAVSVTVPVDEFPPVLRRD